MAPKNNQSSVSRDISTPDTCWRNKAGEGLEGLEGYDFRVGREVVVGRAGVSRVHVRGCTCMSALVVVVMWVVVRVSVGMLVVVVGRG